MSLNLTLNDLKEQAREAQRAKVAAKRDALQQAIRNWDNNAPHADRKALLQALAEYEVTGDHDHGRGRIVPGAPCPGGDCLVTFARERLRLDLRAIERLIAAAQQLLQAFPDVTTAGQISAVEAAVVALLNMGAMP